MCFVFLLYHVGRLWVCQKDPSAALWMTKRGADGFSLVFRSLPSIRFLRCVPLQRVRSGEECPKDCGERSSRIISLPQAGNVIQLSSRTFLAPHRGSSPKGRGGYAAVLHESVGISIASDYSTWYAIPLACPYCLRHFPRRGKQDVT